MKKRREIKVRVNRERLESLSNLYQWLLTVYESGDDYEELLRSHVELMHQRLKNILIKTFRTILVDFTEPEARAFCAVWSRWNLDHDLAGKIAAEDLVQKLEKARSRVHLFDSGL